jgi:lycopene beta-cyclase
VLYDHIIIGGGCAGLQLARALLQNPATQQQSVLILEATDAVPNKSWCFWMEAEHPYAEIVEKRWSQIDITAYGDKMIENILPLQYQYISSERFYTYHYDLFAQHPNVTRTVAAVQEVAPFGQTVKVAAGNTIYTGKQVYDSRMPTTPQPKGSLKQHFLGWFVKSEPPCFAADTATLMDFDIADDSDTGFCYVLPFTEQYALVEMTFFSENVHNDEHYKSLLNQYLVRHFPGIVFTIEKQEVGVIPMTDVRFAGKLAPNVVQIGTSAGMTKPSTGFTFMRILRDSEELVRQVASGAPTIKEYRGSQSRFWFYDALLLGILRRKPWLMKGLMYRLFKAQPFKKVLLFLDERTQPWQEASIFIRLPIGLFLQQVVLTMFKKTAKWA